MTNTDLLQTALDKATDFFAHELGTVRTGRASPSLLEEVKAEYYGTMTPLNQLGSITAPESNLLVVQAWDASAIPAVEKAIRQSQLGLNPAVDGQVIRVPIPPLTEERRHELVKIIKQKAEAARVSIRSLREEAMKAIRDEEQEKTVSQDEAELKKKEIQRQINTANDKIQKLYEQKEKELFRI